MRKKFYLGVISMALVMGFVLTGCGSSPAVSAQEAAAPVDLTGVTSYYVRVDGNNKNAGTSETAPFKTLQRAVEAAAKTPVKKITVIGTLKENTSIKDADPSVKLNRFIFDGTAILAADTSGDERDPDSITITGKQGASERERAVLTSPGGDYTVVIANSTVVFENIEISGNPADPALFVELSHVTLGAGTKIINNTSNEGGTLEYGEGGGIIAVRSILVMRDDAEISGNKCTGQGGGLFLSNSVLEMRSNSKIEGNNAGGSGGGVVLRDSALAMYDAAHIAGNESPKNAGGGVIAEGHHWVYASIAMNGNSKILSNKAAGGGGVYLVDYALMTLNDSAQVSGNTATQIGGGIFGVGEGDNLRVTKGNDAVIANNTAPQAPDSNFTFE